MQNLLFLLIDSLRLDKCLKDFRPPHNIPFISHLRRNGTLCLQAISTTSYTTPSVASILTGTYPFDHGIEWFSRNKLNPECMTLAEILKKAGYHTHAMVVGPLAPYLGLDRGFDEYFYRNETENIYSDFAEKLKTYLDHMEEPWFLFLHLWELHYPIYLPDYVKPKHSFSPYKYEIALSCLNHQLENVLGKVDLDKTSIILTGDHGESLPSFREAILRNLAALLPSFLRIPQSRRRRFWINFQRILFKLLPILRKKQGHGFDLNETLIRVPLILAGKGFPKNKVLEEQVGHVDLLPTILDNLGLPQDVDMKVRGRSCLPLLKGQNLQERPLYVGPAGIRHVQTTEEIRKMKDEWIEGLRTSKWKYISRFSKDEPLELYDLENDPLEQKNLMKLRKEITAKFQGELNRIKSGSSTSRFRTTREEERIIRERLKSLGYM